MPKGPTIPVDTDTSGCVNTPAGVCVEYADYVIVANLPPRPGGYLMDYQVCCRNVLIVNIPNPLRAGYTYNGVIPSNDFLGNSSPQFFGVPPVLVCLGRPISLNLNVSDPNGDSLSYELCDILDDGGFPYPVLTYNSPFNSQSPMAASPPFAVDPITGQLSGTPSQVGQYVVGVCVKEWRNGVAIGEVRLDYQFNVTSCTSIFSDLLTQIEDSTIGCSGLTVNFLAQTQNASTFFWDFGDTTTVLDTSNIANPIYTYPAPGLYEVMLIAEPGDTCGDTAFSIFDVRFNVTSGFTLDTEYCFEQQPLQLNVGAINPDSASYIWNFGPLATPSTSNQKVPPPVSWSVGGDHYIKLTIINGKCRTIYTDTVRISPAVISDMVLPSENVTMLCNGLTVRFVSESVGANGVFWDFGDLSTLADTARTDTATYIFPQQGFYLIQLIANRDGKCWDTTSHLLEVFPELDPEIDVSGELCFEAQDIDLLALGNYPTGTQFFWNLGPNATVPAANSASINGASWSAPGSYTVNLTVTKGGCIASTSTTFNIPIWSVVTNAGPDQSIASGDLLQLQGSPAHSYYWSSSHAVSISNPFGQYTSVEIPTSGDTVYFFYQVTDINGCEGRDTLKVYVASDDIGGGYNIITPNGDGKNDFLDLSGYMLGRDCEFTVLNRWGSEVYHAEKYQNDWPGVDNADRPLPDGTYYYILFCDREVTTKGPITIINSEQR